MSQRRSPEEIIVLSICAICLCGLIPFVFIRFTQGEILVAVIDLVGAVVTLSCFWRVLKTRSVSYVASLIGCLSLAGMSTNIIILGSSEIFFLYPVIIASYFLMRPTIALLTTLTSIGIVVYFISAEIPQFESQKILYSLLATALFTFAFAGQRNRQKDELHTQSRIDQLTGAGNRRALREKMSELVLMHSRDKQPMSLIILDVDDFKTINDLHGHATGDDVLVKLTHLLKARIRATDFLFRYGGDEFLILANYSDLTTAGILSEDIRILLNQAPLLDNKPISVSIGVSEYVLDETLDDWLIRADTAMYSVKRSGKNGVSKAPASASPARVGLEDSAS